MTAATVTMTAATRRVLPARMVWLGVVVTAALAVLLALVLAGSDLSAGFGPIDDHEPLGWLGPDGRLPLPDAVSTLMNATEVGDWPQTARFRPFYYAVRIGQSVAFGTNATLWYASVLLLFAATCTVAGLVFAVVMDRALAIDAPRRRTVAFVVTALAGALAWSGLSAWSGIAARLGPSEGLGLLGLLAVLLAMAMLAFGGSRWWWAALLAGVLVAVWSKESFIGVTGASVVTGVYLFARQRRWSDLVLALVSTVPALVLAPMLVGTTNDIYGRPVGAGRVQVALEAIFDVFLWYWAPAAATLVLAGLVWAWSVTRAPTTATTTRPHAWLDVTYVAVLVVWVIGLLMLDVYVQGGEYVHPRYWAVFDAAKTLMVLGSVALAVAAWRRTTGRARWTTAVVLALALVMVVRLAAGVAQAWSALHREAVANATATVRFDEQMDELVARVGPDGGMGVVITSPVEYEPSRAILQRGYLATARPDGRYLIPTGYAQPDDPTWLALQQLAADGLDDWQLSPADPTTAPGSLVCAYVNVDPFPVDACDPDRSMRVDARGM